MNARNYQRSQFGFFLGLLSIAVGGASAAAKDPFPLIMVDKSKNQLHLAYYAGGKIEIQKSVHVTLGKALGDKEVEKDLKTPEGIYFFTTRLTPPSLKKKFGAMALTVNYPNPIDRKQGKTGYDIMLHATDEPDRLKKDLDSEGCVVVSDEQILELAPHVQLGLTPLLIFPELKPTDLNPEGKLEIKTAFESWVRAWGGKDLDGYIGAYADGFSYNGMNLKRYREYKGSLNQRYGEIQVDVKNVRYLVHPKYDVVIFEQNYSSKFANGAPAFRSTGTKMVYFVKNAAGQFKIAEEEFTTVKER